MGPVLGGVPRLKYSAATTFIQCEGNSLTIGDGVPYGSGLDYPTVLHTLAPISGAFPSANGGSSGQTIQLMRGYTGNNADLRFKVGKANIIIAWEGTNSIAQANSGLTADQALEQMRLYVAERLAAHPTVKVVLVTTIPRMGGIWGDALTNQYLADFNTGLLANWRAWGAAAVVDVRREGSPFAFTGYTSADFNASSVAPYWKVGETTHIHLCPAGYALIAQMVADVLKRLRK